MDDPFEINSVFVVSMADVKTGTTILGVGSDLPMAAEYIVDHVAKELEYGRDVRTHSYLITQFEINGSKRHLGRWHLDSQMMFGILRQRLTSDGLSEFELRKKIREAVVEYE